MNTYQAADKYLRPSIYTLLSGVLMGWVVLSVTGCQSGPGSMPVVPSRQQLWASPAQTVIRLSDAQAKEMQLAQMQARVSDFPLTITVTGEVQAIQERLTHVLTPVLGQVLSVVVQPGDTVARGQVLCRVKSDQVGQLQADLLEEIISVEADLKQAVVQSQLSRSNYRREQKLFQEKISARADMESARTAYEKDMATIATLQRKQQYMVQAYQERLTLFGAPSTAAQQVLETRRINPVIQVRAPRNGLVISRSINTGEFADPQKELFQVADLSEVWVVGQVFEKDVAKIRKGEPVAIRLDSMPGQVFQGYLSYIGSTLKPDSRTLDIRVDVPNPNDQLKPNMFARLELVTDVVKVVTVPQSAIQMVGDKAFVYKPAERPLTFTEQPITLLAQHDGKAAITDGLKAGETVVTQGTLALHGEALRK